MVRPGVLIVEALAQVGAVAILKMEENQGKLGMFTGIDNADLNSQVKPGDPTEIGSRNGEIKRTNWKRKAKATVDGELACEAEIMFAIVDPEK